MTVGDSHGNDHFIQRMCEVAVERDCKIMLQVGDFGYWEHYPEGGWFLDTVSALFMEYGLWGYFIDGNHENHPMLWEKYPVNSAGIAEVRDRLAYLPRGYRWEWDGVKFLAMGGAYSIDKRSRKEGLSWWPEEEIRDEDVEAAGYDKVDILISHDVPLDVDIPILTGRRLFPESSENRRKLQQVAIRTNPYLIIHGHYHDRYSARLKTVIGATEEELLWSNIQVEGLGHDLGSTEGACMVLDTEQFNASRPSA